MRPEKLEFAGVKSYTDKVEIDFNKLLSSGLFGIFGNTGSGKSTILDCIFLALYGRMAKTSERGDYINVKVGKCFVRFTFSLLNCNERRYYQVYREFQIKGDRKSTPQPIAKLYEIKGEEVLPVEDNTSKVNAKLESIIGLSLEDFQKCIVLPQGEFSAFVTLQRSSRLKMVSGLFNLDKYGDLLTDRLKTKLFALDNKIQFVSGQLVAYQDATKESLVSLEETIKLQKDLYDTENIKYLKKQEEFNDFKVNYERRKQFEATKNELNKLKEKLGEINFYKLVLQKLSYAKLYVETCNEKEQFLTKLSENNGELSKLKLSKESVEKDLILLEEKLSDEIDVRRKIDDCTTHIAELKMLESDEKERVNYQNRLLALREDYSQISKEYSDINNKIKDRENQFNLLQSCEKYRNIDEKISFEIDKLVKVSQGQFAAEEITFLKSLDINESCKKSVNDRIEFLSKLYGGDCNGGVKGCVGALNTLYLDLDDLNRKRNEFNNDISSLDNKKSALLSQLRVIEENGKNIRQIVDKINEKVNALTNNEVLSDKITAILKKKECLENSLKSLKEQFEVKNDKLNSLKSEIAVTTTKITAITDNLLKCDEKLKGLAVYFESGKQANDIYAYAAKESSIKTIVDEFDINYIALSEKLKTFNDLPINDCLTDENYEKIKFETQICKENYDKIYINYNNLLKERENLSQKFEKRCRIDRELSSLSDERSVVSELFDSVRNKMFLEYVAEEYLAEIALDAKSILLELTGGRFGLAYSGDFYVEDFIYSSGSRRRVDAVSGGELFLVSLSLALSLSKCIYAKSSMPMEFFFLDEGFGSLDKELVEVVVDCLYKLRNADFSIGIISHVEALKERLPVRVNVVGATGEKGSSITITA